MAYRYGNRNQIRLFPESMEDYIAPDDPVRAYDAFIGALDFRNLGITLDSNKVGNSEYHPHAMLKLLVYGYSYGCLLYTSDAADEEDSVDLGGRRIIKKKKKKKY